MGPEAGECGICYERFEPRLRRPEGLSCGHRLCRPCLARILEGEAPSGRLSCPFCRRQATPPDHAPLPPPLSRQDRGEPGGEPGRGGGRPLSPELLLCPGALEPRGEGGGSSDCLVLTLLEVPEDVAAPAGLGPLDVMRLYRPPSAASLRPRPGRTAESGAWRAFPRCLAGALCLACLGALPVGLYLLLLGRLRPGALLAGLAPSGLLLGALAGLCRARRGPP